MTDTTKTRIQLVNEAMSKGMLVAAGQEPEDEDFEVVDGKVDALIAQLSVDQICEVSDDDAIPSEWFDALAALLANISASDFGKQFSADAKMYHESLLRRINSVRATFEPVQVDYY
jgi:hypothetical protein